MPKNDIKSEEFEEHEIILSNTPTSSTDYIHLALSRNGSLLLQLMSILPRHSVENHRTILSADAVKPFIDMLCEITEYYPEKPKKSPKKKPKPKKRKKI